MRSSSLPIDLRRLANHAAVYAKRDLAMSADECGRISILLHLAAREADRLAAGVAELPELEDEFLALAHDPARAAPEPGSSGYQAALKAQQQQIQRALDAESTEPVSRPGLAALAMPVGGTNVTVFPLAPRPRGDGDAA